MTTLLKRASDEVRVFRLVKHIKDHYPPGAEKPLPGAFRLTNDDIADGVQRNIPPLLSVWDSAKTTVVQARMIRGSVAEYSPFCWSVATIRAIRIASAESLEVYHDPLTEITAAGACGHAGVAGLGKAKASKKEKEAHRELQVRLAEACAPWNEEP